jgi:hypothetical protein
MKRKGTVPFPSRKCRRCAFEFMRPRLHSTLSQAAQALASGATTSERLVAAALERADYAHGVGMNCIVERREVGVAMAAAAAADGRRRAGKALGPLDGACGGHADGSRWLVLAWVCSCAW